MLDGRLSRNQWTEDQRRFNYRVSIPSHFRRSASRLAAALVDQDREQFLINTFRTPRTREKTAKGRIETKIKVQLNSIP